jgi:hypothetical protein
LGAEFFEASGFFGGFDGIHRRAVELAEQVHKVRGAAIGRGEVPGVLGSGDFFWRDAGFAEAFDYVGFNAPRDRTDKAFGRRRQKRRADFQKLRDKGGIAGDPVAHNDAATGLGNADHFLGDIERTRREHRTEQSEGEIEGMIGYVLQDGRVAFLKFEIAEACRGGAPIAGFDEIVGDVNAGDVGAEAGDGESGGAVTAAKIEHAHAGLDAERIGEAVAGLAHEGGNFSEIALFPQGFVRIDSHWAWSGSHVVLGGEQNAMVASGRGAGQATSYWVRIMEGAMRRGRFEERLYFTE